jgi:hypothetical protein
MHTHSPKKPKKFKHGLPPRKLMTALSWHMNEVLMVEFMHQGTTIMSEVYYETLKKNCTGPAIQNKSHGMLTYSVVLLMTMGICIQLLALQHCWSISIGSCLTTLLTALISL